MLDEKNAILSEEELSKVAGGSSKPKTIRRYCPKCKCNRSFVILARGDIACCSKCAYDIHI